MFAKICIALLLLANIVFVVVFLNWFPAHDGTAPAIPRPSSMNVFLRQSRKLLALPLKDPLLIVLGNESCDLDSAISAIALAYFYSQPSNNIDVLRSRPDLHRILPMLNIPRAFLPTKTEVTFFLNQLQIDLENVVCRDEISEAQFEAAHFILVDHHVSAQTLAAIEIIDHRPLDAIAQIPRSCLVNIQQVASCTTLIAGMVLEQNLSTEASQQLLRMLYPVIVLDTVNFSPVADKAKPLDVSVSDRIATQFNITQEERLRVFDELVAARADVSQLDSLQILDKDMKRVMSKKSGETVVVIPGFPISVLEYIQMPGAARNLVTFAQRQRCSIVVLMGMKVVDQVPHRDLAVVKLNDDHLAVYSQIIRDVVAAEDLDVEEVNSVAFLEARIFKQHNVKGSRKQVLPLVQTIVDRLK